MPLPGFRQNEQNKCKLCDGTTASDFTGKGLEIFVVQGCEGIVNCWVCTKKCIQSV